MSLEGHRTEYASNRRYEALKKDRDYWKGRALGSQTASYKDGRMVGIICTNGAWIILAVVAFFVYAPV